MKKLAIVLATLGLILCSNCNLRAGDPSVSVPPALTKGYCFAMRDGQLVPFWTGGKPIDCRLEQTHGGGGQGGGGGSSAFNAITGGTNTSAAMVVGTGASLSATGSGTIVATSTTGNAATATDLASYPTKCAGSNFSQGLSSGSNNCSAVSAAISIGGAVTSGTPGAPLAVNASTQLGMTPYDFLANFATGEAGTGLSGAPWTNSTDNTAGWQTIVNATTTRGGTIDAPGGEFDIAAGYTIDLTGNPNFRARCSAMGNPSGANGQLEGQSGTKLKALGETTPMFKFGNATTSSPGIYTVSFDNCSIWGYARDASTNGVNNSAFYETARMGGGLFDHTQVVNYGTALYINALFDGPQTRSNLWDDNEYGIFTGASASIQDWTSIGDIIGDNDLQGIYIGNAKAQYSDILGMQLARNCRSTVNCTSTPANGIWGGQLSAIVGMISYNPGLCQDTAPGGPGATSCTISVTNPSDGLIVTGSNNSITGGVFGGATTNYAGIHFTTGALNNIAAYNKSYSNYYDYTVDSGANDNRIYGPDLNVSDSGVRTVQNDFALNTGDPTAGGNWVSTNKWPGLFLLDNSANEALWFHTAYGNTASANYRLGIPWYATVGVASEIPYLTAPGELAYNSALEWDNTNTQLHVGAEGTLETTHPGLSITKSAPNYDTAYLENSSNTGYSSFVIADNTGALAGDFGYGNSGAGSFTSQMFFAAENKALCFSATFNTCHIFVNSTGYAAVKLLGGSPGASQFCEDTTTNSTYYTFSTCSSLRALKKNIHGLPSSLAELMAIKPVSFNWRSTGQADKGFIAEDVHALDKACSTYDKDGKLTGYDDRCVLAIAVKSIQEQQAEIEELKKEVAALKATR